jgi:hypothetical protein
MNMMSFKEVFLLIAKGVHLGMNIVSSLFIALACLVLVSCRSSPKLATPLAPESTEKEPIATSLFPSDQAVLGDEAVARILSSKVELPPKAKVAMMKFPDSEGWGSRYYGRYFWRDEEYLKGQQAQVEALAAPLISSGQVADATPLPSLMTPRQVSIPLLREAAVRLQADLLVVFRVGSDTYSQSRAFAKDKVKAYSTCELVLLDVRTGLVPFSRVVSRERLELKTADDLDLSETMRRAEQASAMDALRVAAEDLAQFIKGVPRRGG